MATTSTYGDVSYVILEHIGLLKTYDYGYRRECNIVAWNGNEAKVDIRDWNDDHTKMTRGIALDENEAESMARVLTEYLNKEDRLDIGGYVPEPLSAGQVTFSILEHIGVIRGENHNGWRKEINIVSWNGGKAKFDIRDWDPEHERMTRGITMTADEIKRLIEALNKRYKNAA